ncbi:MAG: S8 family peptidase [Chloroflexota bacterium]|nr:S8 family peptidase [Chloroflexota bacterium]
MALRPIVGMLPSTAGAALMRLLLAVFLAFGPLAPPVIAGTSAAQIDSTGGMSAGTPLEARADDDDDEENEDEDEIGDYDAMPPESVWAQAIGLDRIAGTLDGDDVTVAVIDTGVTRVADLDEAIVARVDLTPDRDGLDRYGHGTHMIGIIAGDGSASRGRWRGVAPGAEVVSIKVGGWDGATDVSAVIAGIQWAVSHRARYDIRVLNLAYGTDASQSVDIDPLDRAVQRAWEAGILVVTAAGNRGPYGGTVSKPADDRFVLTVGASDVHGTPATYDDTVAPFSSRGPTPDGAQRPDLVAPGISIVASRAPGSTIDTFRPEGRQGGKYFKGTGTSQAAAIVSGVAALLFEVDPDLTPDEAKALLMATARPMPGQAGSGAGQLDAAAAVALLRSVGPLPAPALRGPASSGTGSIEASRGSHKVFADPDRDGRAGLVTGEVDALGRPFDGASWARTSWTRKTWSKSPWAAVTCVADEWSVPACGASRWGGMSWSRKWWGHRTWAEAGWDAESWTAKSWTAKSWTSGHWN